MDMEINNKLKDKHLFNKTFKLKITFQFKTYLQ